MDRKIYNYDGQSVYLETANYRNNDTLAVLMFNVNGEPYGAVTVNLCSPFQSHNTGFVDENNMPGIGKWLEDNNLALPMNIIEPSGYCRYQLYMFIL